MKGAESNWHSWVLKAENDLLSIRNNIAAPRNAMGRRLLPRPTGGRKDAESVSPLPWTSASKDP